MRRKKHIFSDNGESLQIEKKNENEICIESAQLCAFYSAMNARSNETPNLKLITLHKFDLNKMGIVRVDCRVNIQ